MLRTLLASLLLALSGWVQADTLTTRLDDLTLNGRFVAAVEQADRPTVLITHGTLAHNGMELIENLQQVLADAGFASLAINLSLGLDDRRAPYPCQHPHRHRHEDAVREIAHWVDLLMAQGHDRLLLLGHSRGGNQTAWYSRDHAPLPAAVIGQVLLAPMTWDAARERAQYRQRHGQPLEPLLNQARQHDRALLQPVGLLYCTDTAATAAALLSYHGDNPDLHTPNLLRATRLPTLVIAGSADSVVSDLPAAMATLDNPQVQLRVLDGADHFFRDLYTDDVVDALAEFSDQLP